MEEIRAFNLKFHPLMRTDFLSAIKYSLHTNRKIIQIGINSASVNESVRNEELRHAVNNADLVNVDGISVLWALRLLGYYVPERVATPDLADDIIAMAEKEGFSIFLFGATETTVTICKKKLEGLYPHLRIAGYRNGYFSSADEIAIVEMINKSEPDILFIALPSPKKESFFNKYGHLLVSKYILGVGGYFDVLAGVTRRAPSFIQRLGMEWLYRFAQEPGRLWRRYLIGNIKFIWLLLKEKFFNLKE